MKGKRTSDHIFFLQTIIEKIVKRNKKRLFTVFIDFKKAYDTVNRYKLIDRLKHLGINGIFLGNIIGMYSKVDYKIKLKNGYTRPLSSNLGLKQGCPLSPMLFNLYIDDINNIFDDSCDPIDIQNEKFSHFLYADDLVIISESKIGLQNCLDKAHYFAKSKGLTISEKKSKIMIFNVAGRLIKESFSLNGNVLESVQSFCYLGFDVKCSGTVKHAMNVLNDKGKKAMKALLIAIRRFNIPFKTSVSLFHTFISPILMYNAENWTTLTDLSIQRFDKDSLFLMTTDSNTDITHRKFLRNILGLSRSCPSLAVYGETGEIPLSLKSFRLTLMYWYRLTKLPDTDLAKKALLENIQLHTNWITTIEKVIGAFNFGEHFENESKFKRCVKTYLEDGFWRYWKKELLNDQSRLLFYKKSKTEYTTDDYLERLNFEERRTLTKLRCSDHSLEIEKGRHKKVDRGQRLCLLCPKQAIEDEEHFLLHCDGYLYLRTKYDIKNTTPLDHFFGGNFCTIFVKFVREAYDHRETVLKGAI